MLTSLSGLQSTPIGRIRLLCPRLAAKTVVGPKLGQFVRDYPDVELEITTDDSRVDLVSAGYDAGIQFGEYIAQDMVAVRVSPDLRPADRRRTRLLRLTPEADVSARRAEPSVHPASGTAVRACTSGNSTKATSPSRSRSTVRCFWMNSDLVIQAALDGAGLAWVAEDRVTEHLASGALVRVLEDWCPPFPGFFLYYPTRKQQPAALTALITTLRLAK